MRVGIVGSEQAKFTPETEKIARRIVRGILIDAIQSYTQSITAVSGHCHLGGVDIYVEEEVEYLCKNTLYHPLIEVYPPAKLQWEGGYKQRNIQIAQSDIVHCITVTKLPESYYSKFRFSDCYHCQKHPNYIPHVKSGGCWTMWHCKQQKLWII